MKRPFLLRIDSDVLDAVQRWANDDLRSVNAQIDFVLRRALKEAGRKPVVRTELPPPDLDEPSEP